MIEQIEQTILKIPKDDIVSSLFSQFDATIQAAELTAARLDKPETPSVVIFERVPISEGPKSSTKYTYNVSMSEFISKCVNGIKLGVTASDIGFVSFQDTSLIVSLKPSD